MNDLVVLLKGGTSEEREVSLSTCSAIEIALKHLKKKYEIVDPQDFAFDKKIDYKSLINKIKYISPDIVFNGLHGGEGEDGSIQEIFELFDISFTGSSSNSSFVAMNKLISKLLAKNLNIPVPPGVSLSKDQNIQPVEIINELSLPVVVKPNSSGSSVGITVVNKDNVLTEAINKAFRFDDKILIEKYIAGREITVAILGKQALPVVEIKAKNGWYDYIHKYTKGQTIYETPADLSREESERVQQYAEEIFSEMSCSDYARVDFRFDDKKFYFLELNTLPGMTDLSLVPMAAKAAGDSFDELIRKICERDF